MKSNNTNWEWKKLGEVADIIMGQSPPSDTYNEKQDGLPFFQGKAEFSVRFPEVRKYCSKPVRIAEQNNILMSVRAPVGSLNIADKKCCIGRGLCVIKSSNRINYLFLYHFLKSIERSISEKGEGSTFTAINKKTVERIEIPVPPLPIQQKIVSILERAENLKQNREQANEEGNKISQSVFYKMFGDPIKNEKKYIIDKLNNICDVRDGTHDSPKYKTEGFPLVTSKNVKDGYIDFSTANLISKDDLDKINKRSAADDGDIIMPMIGTIGNPIIIKKDREFGIKNVALIKFNKSRISNIYIKCLLSGSYFDYIAGGSSRGGTQKFIALKDIRNIPIPLPPISLQNQFASIVEKIETVKQKQSKATSEISTLFDALMQKAFKEELS